MVGLGLWSRRDIQWGGEQLVREVGIGLPQGLVVPHGHPGALERLLYSVPGHGASRDPFHVLAHFLPGHTVLDLPDAQLAHAGVGVL